MKYVSKTLPHHMLVRLDQLRKKKIHCDITIVAGASRTKYPAHRVVLASGSNYFDAMLGGNFTESQENEIFIGDVEDKSIKVLVDFIYTSEITVDEDNVQSLLQACTYLQIIEVKEICCEFLKQRLNPSNCMTIKTLAHCNGCVDLTQAARNCLANNFDKFSQSEEFKSLGVEQVIDILSSDDTNIQSEELLYESALTWISYDRDERQKLLSSLLQYIRKHLIPKEYLHRIVGDHQHLMQSFDTRTRRSLKGNVLFAIRDVNCRDSHGMLNLNQNTFVQRYCSTSQCWYHNKLFSKKKVFFGSCCFK